MNLQADAGECARFAGMSVQDGVTTFQPVVASVLAPVLA